MREREGERERVENDESRKINYDSNWIFITFEIYLSILKSAAKKERENSF